MRGDTISSAKPNKYAMRDAKSPSAHQVRAPLFLHPNSSFAARSIDKSNLLLENLGLGKFPKKSRSSNSVPAGKNLSAAQTKIKTSKSEGPSLHA